MANYDVSTRYEYQPNLITRLRKYYASNDLYRHRMFMHPNSEYFNDFDSQDAHVLEWQRRVKPLRNVVPRAVDFFALKMLPGDIQITTENKALKDVISQILKWSNFNENKKKILTDLALTGDLFLKLNLEGNKVFFSFIEPEDVTEIREDARGFLTYVRIDYEIENEKGEDVEYTEIWTKEYYAVYMHTYDRSTKVEDLGTPIAYGFNSEFGASFLPIVHIKFKDGARDDYRGTGCATQALDLIDELNRQATVQAKNAFRNNQSFVLSPMGIDKNNFSLETPAQINVIRVDGSPDDVWIAPTATTITSLLAGIDWSGLEKVLEDGLVELHQEIPALRYFSIQDMANISEKTVTLFLDSALSQAKESARSFISGLIRMCQMCITCGSYAGVLPNLGSYENGSFDFTIETGETFTVPLADRILMLQNLVSAKVPLESAMKICGFSEKEISDVEAGKEAAVNKVAETVKRINEAQNANTNNTDTTKQAE